MSSPPAGRELVAAPAPEGAEAAIVLERRELYERWSRPLLGIGFPAYGRGLLVAYPHRVGYALWAVAAVSVLVHLMGGNFIRPTWTTLVGTALVAVDRISLKRPWLRMFSYCVAAIVAIGVDEATKTTLFHGWDR